MFDETGRRLSSLPRASSTGLGRVLSRGALPRRPGGVELIVLDLSELQFIDSCRIALFIKAEQEAQSNRRSLVVIGVRARFSNSSS
jgi:hypothetical protein